MTIRERIANLTSPIARELFGNLADELEAAIVVPNEMLPARYRQTKQFDIGNLGSLDGKVYGRTLRKLNKMSAKRERIADAREAKADRLRRVEFYRNQMDMYGLFAYDEAVDMDVAALSRLADKF